MARNEDTHRPTTYYCNLPPGIGESDVLLIDPMLATGHSSAAAADQLKAEGAKRLRFLCLVACPEGIAHFSEQHPDVPIYTAAVDERLDENAYIVPGLGDAGDRYFGTL
jgi:uracil phosphoribosyltransferase